MFYFKTEIFVVCVISSWDLFNQRDHQLFKFWRSCLITLYFCVLLLNHMLVIWSTIQWNKFLYQFSLPRYSCLFVCLFDFMNNFPDFIKLYIKVRDYSNETDNRGNTNSKRKCHRLSLWCLFLYKISSPEHMFYFLFGFIVYD